MSKNKIKLISFMALAQFGLLLASKSLAAGDQVYNPIPTDNLTDTVLMILRWFLAVIGIFSITFVAIGGFRMVTAQGDEKAYESAKKTVTWAVLGLVVALMSFAIIAMVQNVLGAKIQQ